MYSAQEGMMGTMKKSVLTGPLAMLKCEIGKREAKQSPRKNTMRHFCGFEIVNKNYVLIF